MKLNKDYQYHVLCEDVQMRTFIQAVLADHDVDPRKIRFSNYPPGMGCGEAFVRRELPREIKILHATNYARKVLIVCTDADVFKVDERIRQLENEVKSQGVKWNRSAELVVLWVPKREIETWIHFLKGEQVDEKRSYRHSGRPVRCKKEATLFSKYCHDTEEIDCSMVPSLSSAKQEYVRVCRLQKQQ